MKAILRPIPTVILAAHDASSFRGFSKLCITEKFDVLWAAKITTGIGLKSALNGAIKLRTTLQKRLQISHFEMFHWIINSSD